MLFENMRHYSRLIGRGFNRLLDYLLPPVCLFCGFLTRTHRLICDDCEQELPSLKEQDYPCHLMQNNAVIPADRILSLFRYEPPIVQLLVKLKFHAALPHATLLSDLCLSRIKNDWYVNHPLPDLILPVPLHPIRLRERGFNQAVEIARPISQALAIPLELYHCTRSKHTAAQSGLGKAERAQNLKNAFTTSRRYDGLSIAVLDDVMTTGHTLSNLCKTLRQAGAKHIDVWCCARTVPRLDANFYQQDS